MSATNRGAIRQKDDAYYTPKWAVHRVLEWMYDNMLSPVWHGQWLEPCVGAGNVVNAVNEWHTKPKDGWRVNDLNPTSHIVGYSASDFLTWPKPEQKFTICLSNPPYSLAKEFVDQGLKQALRVIYLLRLNFLGSIERAEWLGSLNPTVLVLPNRPIFALNDKGKPGSDACEYAWFIFGVQPYESYYQQIHILKKTSKEEIKAANQELITRNRR